MHPPISFARTPLDEWLAARWSRIDRTHKLAFLVAACVSLLAFGFEMTNLTLHHDDLNHLMVQKPLVGYYLGRFVHAWLFFYGQQGLFVPFLDMTIGMALMCGYGVLVAHLWGARRTLDLALIAAILCVFPYMAHIYQYNSVMVGYPLAHLLVATGVALALRTRLASMVAAALLFFVAFSIYQAVLANAVAILLVWVLLRVLGKTDPESYGPRALALRIGAVLMAVAVGGLLHVVAVSSFNIPFDSAQGADKAFSLGSRLESAAWLVEGVSKVATGTRAFFIWPEAYLPNWLKALQLTLLVSATLAGVASAPGFASKAAVLVLLGLTVLSPQTLQAVHPHGNFHQLTLTAYGLVVAGCTMMLLRSRITLVRNVSILVASLVVVGYVVQCNWISTVGYLNTQAHQASVTQILARLRSMGDPGWDGKTVLVLGSYDMPSSFPFKPATGVASEFMNPAHMTLLARLLRDEATFVKADASAPNILEFARGRPAWPSPDSVGVVNGAAIVILSKSQS